MTFPSPLSLRSDTIPVFFPSIAPHLRESAVLKMLHEEEPTGKVRGSQWPPADSAIGHKPSSFFTKVSRGQGGTLCGVRCRCPLLPQGFESLSCVPAATRVFEKEIFSAWGGSGGIMCVSRVGANRLTSMCTEETHIPTSAPTGIYTHIHAYIFYLIFILHNTVVI